MRYYFLGICGTAMGSLAVLLKRKGHEVWGSDQGIYPPMSDFLREHHIPLIEGFAEENLKRPFDRVVIGNAMSRGNVEVEAILNRRLPFVSLPEVIRREFVEQHKNIVLTGTHGKTTTTALTGWVLQCAGLSPTMLVGGIARNFDTSVLLGEGDYFVIEGDEYDCAFFDKRPKFAHYFPSYLVVNNLEFDHADIYENLAEIQAVFRKLLRVMPGNGLTIANGDSPAVLEILDPMYSRLQVFGRGKGRQWGYHILETGSDGTRFEILESGRSVGEFTFPFPGEYQVQNALAVAAVARDIGIEWDVLRRAFAGFLGVKRRMEHWGLLHGADVYDDFAHHPTAIGVCLQAMRDKFPDRRLVALFEPRTNTTVRHFFQQELVTALAAANVLLITPIHRAGRIPEAQRLSLQQLKADLETGGCAVHLLDDHEAIPRELKDVLRPRDVLILLTNGGLGGQYQQLRASVTPAG